MQASPEIELVMLHYPQYESPFEGWTEPVQDWWCNENRKQAIAQELRTPQGQALARALADQPQPALDADLVHELTRLLALEPVDKSALQALRARVDALPAASQKQYGALVAWRELAGQSVLNDSQTRMLCRSAWFQKGLASAPLRLETPCPGCPQRAVANLQHVETAKWHHCWAWSLTCPHCGYVERGNPDWQLPTQESDIREAFTRNPATGLDHPYAQSCRQELLEALRLALLGWERRLTDHLSNQLARASEAKIEAWCRQHSFKPDFEMARSHASAGCHWPNDTATLRVAWAERGRQYGAPLTALDQQLKDAEQGSRLRWEFKEGLDRHPAAHWAVAYETRLSHLRQALAQGDALEAAVHVQLFVVEGRERGFLLPAVVRVWAGPGVRLPTPPVEQLAAGPLEEELPSCAIDALSQHLAQWPGNTLSAEELQRALQVFARAQTRAAAPQRPPG